jgi:hypothetical protein
VLVRRRIAVGLGLAVVVLGIVVVAFLLGGRSAMVGLSIKRVTATDIANAMKDDHFYSDYGQSTLLLDGTVVSVSTRGNDLIAEFKTNSAYQALCDLGAHSASGPHVGDRILVIAEGASGERQPSAVLLHNCVVP